MEYWVLSEDTLDTVAERSGRDRNYFEREMKQQALYDNTLVVYFKDGLWKQVAINNHYNVKFVMEKMEDQL